MAKKKSVSLRDTRSKEKPTMAKAQNFMACPTTGEKIWVTTATLADLKKVAKTGACPNAKRKQLVRITSKAERLQRYQEAAEAIEAIEQRLLPPYGGRPWKVSCRITEPSTRQKPPLFRWFRGRLELACIPHLLEKIPDPPRFKGAWAFADDEEEEANKTSLQERAISSLSTAAWLDRQHAIPNVKLKWLSPNHEYFYSRKAAWDHAALLAEQDVFLDKVLMGLGARGQELRPTKVTKAIALKAGKLRFLRDGLWVVGQEESWQSERAEQLEQSIQHISSPSSQQEKETTRSDPVSKCLDVETVDRSHQPQMLRAAIAASTSIISARRTNGLALYLRSNRDQYRSEHTPSSNEESTTGNAIDRAGLQTKDEVDSKLPVIWQGLSQAERQTWEARANNETTPPVCVATQSPSKSIQAAPETSTSLSDQPSEQRGSKSPVHSFQTASSEAEASGLLNFLKSQQAYKLEQHHGEVQASDDDTCLGNDTRGCQFTLPDPDKELSETWKSITEEERAEWHRKAQGEAGTLTSAFIGNTIDSPGRVTPSESSSNNEHATLLKDSASGSALTKTACNDVVGNFTLEKTSSQSDPTRTSSSSDPPAHDSPTSSPSGPLRKSSNSDSSADDASAAYFSEAPKSDVKVSVPISCSCIKPASGSLISEVELAVSNRNTPIDLVETELEAPSGRVATEILAARKASGSLAVVDSNLSGDSYCPGNGVATVFAEDGLNEASLFSSPCGKRRRRLAECPPRRFNASSHWRMSPEHIELCYEAAMSHFEAVMHTVKSRDLTRELEDGFDVLRERGRGRYDMELPIFDTPAFDFLTDLQKAPWMPVVREILGEEVVLIHKGVFLSLPGAEPQVYHQDGLHLATQTQRPCHAINVFIPLLDLSLRNGPTQFCVGSHILGFEDLNKDFLVTPTPKKGTPIIFDYRLGHKGLGNTSSSPRPLVYCTYAAAADGKEFRDSVNFSRKRYRKIGELIERPLSRDERRQKRQRSLEDREIKRVMEAFASMERSESGKQNLSSE